MDVGVVFSIPSFVQQQSGGERACWGHVAGPLVCLHPAASRPGELGYVQALSFFPCHRHTPVHDALLSLRLYLTSLELDMRLPFY